MPRKPRIHYPGAFYHVMVRGNAKGNIFFTENDRAYFYFLLQETTLNYQYRLHGFCLMSNHVHLIIEVGDVPLSKIMQNICFRYTRYINLLFDRVGHLFQGRYKAILIEADHYLLSLTRYVHLNPIRANMVKNLNDYPWSSHRAYLGIARFSFLTIDFVLGYFHNNVLIARELYKQYLSSSDSLETSQINFNTGNQKNYFVLGSDDFVKNLSVDLSGYAYSEITLEQIIDFVCNYYSIIQNDLKSIARKSVYVNARASIAWLAQKLEVSTVTEVARYFSKDATTLIEKIRKLNVENETITELNNILHLFLENPVTQA
jgi:putative transposase